MVKSNRSRTNSRRDRSRKQGQNSAPQQIDLLKQLVSLQDQSRIRMEPDIPDVPRMRLAPQRCFTGAFSYTALNITGNSTTPTNGAITFALSNATDYTSWVNCFDSYRIAHVQVEFIPASIGLTGTSNMNGILYSAIDYDDATTLDSTGLLQYDTVQVVNSPQFFERRLVPRAAKAMYSGAVFNGYGQDTAPWIDTNSPAVQHYGVKYSQSITSSAVTTYSVVVTMFVNFRNGH
jgi:hypothetical protein